MAELAAGLAPDGRVRRPGAGRPGASAGRRSGAGRKPVEHTDPDLLAALEALVDPATRGDPQSPLR